MKYCEAWKTKGNYICLQRRDTRGRFSPMHDPWEAQSRAEAEHFWFQGFRRFVQPVLRDVAGDAGDLRILDCGCGTGNNLHMLSEHGQVFAFELATAGLSRAIRAAGGRPLVQASVTRIPFQSNTFDLVTLFDVLQCVPDDTGAIDEAARVLRPGGTAVLTVAAFPMLRGDHSEVWAEAHRYTRLQIVQRVEASGLRPLGVSFLFASTFPLMLAVRTWQRLSRRFRRWQPDSDIKTPREPLNRTLTWLLALEAVLARRVPLPIGSTLLVVARKPSATL
jgi:SAM-dependent methyltransferase